MFPEIDAEPRVEADAGLSPEAKRLAEVHAAEREVDRAARALVEALVAREIRCRGPMSEADIEESIRAVEGIVVAAVTQASMRCT